MSNNKKKSNNLAETNSVEKFEFEQKTIRGYPELHWTGKRPFNFTYYYPA